jgi:type VI secretion system secreted protein VgrG
MARMYELTTPLAKDVLLFRALRGREELSRMSEFDLSAVSTRADILPGELLGKSVTVKIELRDGGHRYLNGHVTRFAQGGSVGRLAQYRLTVNPALWFLTRTADCRIFQQKSVPDILGEILGSHGVLHRFALDGIHRPREYCVQYRETDFAFVSRLMEEEGISYFLDHADDRHTLHLVDSDAGYPALAKAAIRYFEPDKQVRVDEEFIHAWTFAQSIQPGMATLDDYDPLKPKVDLAARAKRAQPHDRATHEWYDWPGEYSTMDQGEYLAHVRIDEFHAGFERAEARTNVREIAVGRTFTLQNAPRPDQQQQYLIASADYDLRDNAYESSPEEPATYHCTFTVLPVHQGFRPARLTPRPTVKGVHSAVVVGPGGEEIWTDKYGRVKVQFHWDREGKKDENSSCWIRVSHPWAGASWGAVALPRIGQEVIVDFLEGDPDQPIIVGRVYNADQMPPYELPGNKTMSGVKSRSSLKGTPANFNELRFEDKKGEEHLLIHAEKNQDIEVEHDEGHWVGHDRTKTIGHDETTHVKHDRTEIVDGNESITIHGQRTETVGKDETITVHGNRTETVDKDETITIDGSRAATITGKETTSVGKDRAVTITGRDTLDVGKSLSITAADTIVLTVGDASITMKKDGTIIINGKDITLTGSGNIAAKAGKNVTLKGQKVQEN